jgi:hypothetical protein
MELTQFRAYAECVGMPEIDRAYCRRAAAECTELARITADPAKRQLLLRHAQEWLKLAYSEGHTKFERLLTHFNAQQMDVREQTSAPVQRRSMQQQEVQQQQSKAEREDKK